MSSCDEDIHEVNHTYVPSDFSSRFFGPPHKSFGAGFSETVSLTPFPVIPGYWLLVGVDDITKDVWKWECEMYLHVSQN